MAYGRWWCGTSQSIPWDDTTDLGYAVECYNDSGETGLFGELEYHTPAIGGGTGLTTYLDCSQVWAFRGEEQPIRTVGERLLGQGLLTDHDIGG